MWKIMLKKLTIFILVFSMSVMMFACGAGVKNGFVKQNGQTYYYVDDVMKTGWQKINGDWYYFYESDYVDGEMKGKGTMNYNNWLKDGNDWYFFASDGKLLMNSWLNDDDTGARYYLGSDGKMIVNTTKEINGDLYIFDNNGVGVKQPDYMLTFNCTFPKTFSCSAGDVIIENIRYDNNLGGTFSLYWTGTDGRHDSYYLSTSTTKSVGWKLYDPEGYLIDSGTFYTDSLFYGDKFRDKREFAGDGKVEKKGVYKLELMNSR